MYAIILIAFVTFIKPQDTGLCHAQANQTYITQWTNACQKIGSKDNDCTLPLETATKLHDTQDQANAKCN